jgi:hypothetical protein
MGTAEDEAKARDELERVRTENAIREMERQRALEEYRKQQEQQQNKMVADPGAGGAAWPDNEVQAGPQTGVDKVAGALRVGRAGDVAFARDLLNTGQAPLGGVNAPDQAADGAKESTAGSRAAKPALGLG